MARRISRLSVVALVAVSVCIVFLVLCIISEPQFEGEIHFVDKDEIPVFAAEVSTISLPITFECAAIERMAMEEIGNKPLMEDKLWLKNVRCSLCGGKQYHKVTDFLGFPIYAPCPCLLKGLAKSFAVSYKLHMESLKIRSAHPGMRLVGRIRARASAHAFGATGSSATTIEFTSDRVLAPAEGEGVIAFRGQGKPRISFVKPLELSLRPFKIPVPLQEILNRIPELLKVISGPVDRELGKSLDKPITEGWKALHETIKLTDEVWLVLHPEELQVAQLRGQGTTLETTVTVLAHPKVVLGDEPQVPEVPPMPPVRLGEAKGGLHVVVDAIVPLDEAERLLNEERGELEKVVYDQARVKVRVPKARIYSHENRLRLELLVTEPFRGSVFLEGAPMYDAENGELYVEGLDFTAETRNLLAKSASWLLGNRLFKDYLQRKVRLPVGGPLAKVGESISGYEKEVADGVVFQVGDTSFKMLGVYNTREAMHLFVQADVSAKVTII